MTREFSPEESAAELMLRLRAYRGAKDAAAELRALLADRDAYFRENAVRRLPPPSDGQGRLFG